MMSSGWDMSVGRECLATSYPFIARLGFLGHGKHRYALRVPTSAEYDYSLNIPITVTVPSHTPPQDHQASFEPGINPSSWPS
jgi:hypothetical protein